MAKPGLNIQALVEVIEVGEQTTVEKYSRSYSDVSVSEVSPKPAMVVSSELVIRYTKTRSGLLRVAAISTSL